jgi:hypothetical protein
MARVEFRFLVYTISKNAMANDPTGGFRCARAPDEIDVDGGVFN